MTARSFPRWPLAVIVPVAVAIWSAAHPWLYQIASLGGSPFEARLDTLTMAGIPPLAALYAAAAVWQRWQPANPTVLYRFYDAAGALLYVGITRDIKRRTVEHRRKDWWPDVARTDTRTYRNRIAAARAEHAAITREDPRYNVARFTLDGHIRSQGTR